MLQTAWTDRKDAYDIVIIGSGYGGAITAARLASAKLAKKPSVCILERGREWEPGKFPETPAQVLPALRGPGNPLGLYELLNHTDISVLKGSGLGGTSLINANVAIVPDQDVFEQFHWPSGIQYKDLLPYYDRARKVLAAGPHPRAMELPKVQALDRRAREIGTRATALDIAVNFTIDGANPYDVEQKPCIDCGNCVTGCNVRAKNTLYMNYLPMAKKAGATILTQTKVEWLEKRAGGGWRIHGQHVTDDNQGQGFTLDAGEIVLSAGSLNSTEILLRSEAHGLPVSPALGTKFSGNGDFFGLAYNGDFETDDLGYRYQEKPGPGDSPEPGPNIVGVIRYTDGLPEAQRIAVEDFSFPSASTDAARILFGAIRGVDTYAGNEAAQNERLLRDIGIGARSHDPGGALNHSMLYLVMGIDDARGTILFEAPPEERDGRIRISWDKGGQQQVFTRMNEELRRHARALRGNFISNPTWSFFNLRHLITAHPLGGCPMGDDHWQGAIDVYGRVFAGDGSVHQGLYVTDGSVIPSALGVNPFLTISALTERFAERKIRQLGGEAYPEPTRAVSMAGIDAMDAIEYNEGQLEALFRRSPTLGIDKMMNSGQAVIDRATKTIHNDRNWKGFLPKGHVLNTVSSAIFTGFVKEFHQVDGKYTGVTTDSDGRVRVRNSMETVVVKHGDGGTLEAGTYILLKYLDPPWQGFHDVLKLINEDLIIGRTYIGQYPNGSRLLTFAMSRRYGFDHMSVDDHRALFDTSQAPAAAEVEGAWRMDVISNANHTGSLAWLQFNNKPDGRLEARYEVLGVLEGMVVPTFVQDHFQLNDFTPLHDEIRKVSDDFLIGKYVAPTPQGLATLLGNASLGLFHTQANGQSGFYYTLTRDGGTAPTNVLLRPFLDVQLPDGVGLIFDEEMTGWYFAGQALPDPPPTEGDNPCSFKVRMTIADVNEFVDGYEHEAQLTGSITFGNFEGAAATYPIDGSTSRFHYLRVNPATREAEMNYHLEFADPQGRRFTLDGRKFMQKDSNSIQEILVDYTTLFSKVSDGSGKELGSGLLKFRTFENLAAIGNLAAFLASFQVTGTDDPGVQLQARMRFLAFTGQFVGREYNPLGL